MIASTEQKHYSDTEFCQGTGSDDSTCMYVSGDNNHKGNNKTCVKTTLECITGLSFCTANIKGRSHTCYFNAYKNVAGMPIHCCYCNSSTSSGGIALWWDCGNKSSLSPSSK